MISITRAAALTLLGNNSLDTTSTYYITDVQVLLMPKSNNAFFERPLQASKHSLSFDYETYDIRTNRCFAYLQLGGVIRCTNGVWGLINDAGHIPKGITSVSNANNSGFKINFSITADRVIDFSTSIDETYSASNLCISCGASVGFAHAIILLHKTLIVNNILQKSSLTHTEASIPSSNIWVKGTLLKIINIS
jgi:hypothetical protein